MEDDQSEDDGFDHPDDIPVTKADDVPEVDSALDAADGDEERVERLQEKAAELREEAESNPGRDTPEDGPTTDPSDDEGDGTRVRTRADVSESETVDHNSPDPDDSVFDADEEAEIEEAFGEDFELEPLEDVPDDFDYESQDTTDFGVAEDEMVIEHNDTLFKLEAPTGVREDQFWSEMQNQNSMADAFDAMIRYAVTRPEDIATRMEEENWTSFAKAGLAIKCASFLGLDQLQDF